MTMNTRPDNVKICFRCEKPVRLTPEQAARERDQESTTCTACRSVYAAEAGEILKRASEPFPKAEAPNLNAPAAPANQP